MTSAFIRAMGPKKPKIKSDQIRCTKCGVQWVGRSLCHCTVCHLTFTSIGPFDDHRTGSHTHDTRRCRTQEEIRARGYEPNHLGYWRKPRTDAPNHWAAHEQVSKSIA